MSEKTALVLGASGTIGSAIVAHLAVQGWKVAAVSRRMEAATTVFSHLDTAVQQRIIPLSVDLTRPAALAAALQPFQITHVFFAALAMPGRITGKVDPTNARKMLKQLQPFMPIIDSIGLLRRLFYTQMSKAGLAYDPEHINLHMLQNVITVCSASAHHLQHVALVTGAKYYGMHLTPYLYRNWKVPFTEDSPRAPGPNFYFEMEDALKSLHQRTRISWTVVRPTFVIGTAVNSAYNLLNAIAVYASLLKAQGLPLIFPGDPASADTLVDFNDADLIADLLRWSAENPLAHNQAFNAVNENPMPWRDVWTALAAYFGMEPEFRTDAFDSWTFFENSAEQWQALVNQHNLQPVPLKALVSSRTLAETFVQDWDATLSAEKAHRLGFTHKGDTIKMFTKHLNQMRMQKLIP